MKKRVSFIVCVMFVCVHALGCEAFVRKFTRKPKKEQTKVEEQVVAPEDYTVAARTSEEAYREDFFIWRSWHEELVYWLVKDGNRKKQMDCLRQTKKSLQELGKLLGQGYALTVSGFISQLDELAAAMEKDIYGQKVEIFRQKAEALYRQINRQLSFASVKDALQ